MNRSRRSEAGSSGYARLLMTVAALAGLAVVTGASPAAQSPGQAWTPELQMQVKRINQVAVSPDGRRVAVVVAEAAMEGDNSEWLSQIHVAEADGSRILQLTRGDKSSTSPRWSPDGDSLAFLSKRSGKNAVWRIRLTGGEAEKVTDEKGEISQLEWAPDGKSIAYVMEDPKSDDEEKASKEKRDWRTLDENIKFLRLYTIPVGDQSGERRGHLLTPGSLSVIDFSWSPDSQFIAFSHQPTPSPDDWTKSDVSVVAVASGEVKALAAGPGAEQTPRYSPDGRWVAFRKSEAPPSWAFASTVQVVAAGGGAPRALAETPDLQPSIVGWSADGGRLFVTETLGTRARLLALPVDGRPPVALGADRLQISNASVNLRSSHIGFVNQWADKAPEAFVARLDGEMTPVGVTRLQTMGDVPLGKSEVVTWKAPDGLAVEGILTYPVGYQQGSRAPLVVIVHGGPTGVFTQTFIGTAGPYPIAAFAASGYAVLRCNVRGSSGYGAKFRHANLADWGGGDYRDIMAGVDHVIQMGVADPDRLGVMGWSYGGYMTSWIVTQIKRFKAASVGAGVTNLMSFSGTTDIPSFLPFYFGGEYWDTFDVWRAHSAMFHVKGVSTPTLIQHGEADVRVPVSQGYEFYSALKRQGVVTKMTVYPRQPHGFEEPKMTLDAARANLEWFNRWLGRSPTPTSSKP